MRADLHHTRQALREGRTSLQTVWHQCLALASGPICAQAFRGPVQVPPEWLLAQDLKPNQPLARASSAQEAINLIATELAGLPVSVKDLFDVAGQTTAAGSQVLAGAPPATQDCPAVARLRAAGAGLMGRTHMVEFAYSGVGTNPHFGTPVNPADPATPRIAGGSSSGAAVSVASGAAFVGLGSDTGGSLRIPAALCGLVGFKPTARTVPTAGTVPLSHTLDTVGAITRSVRDAALVHGILSARAVVPGNAPLASYRLAVPKTGMLDGLDASVARAFERALTRLGAAGARLQEIPLSEITELGQIQSRAGFAAPEALAWHRRRGLWPTQRALYDPRVAQRIALAQSVSAADYIALQMARADWIARAQAATQGFDALLSPTVPMVAPPIASLAPAQGLDAAQDAACDAEFFRVNALLLRNTSVVNFIDGCALSLPCQQAGELPVGLMIWAGPMQDDTVLAVAQQVQAALG